MSGPSRPIVSQQDFFGEDAEAQRTQSGKDSGRFARAGRHTVRSAILAFSASSAPLCPPQKILAYLVWIEADGIIMTFWRQYKGPNGFRCVTLVGSSPRMTVENVGRP
jgi:hypothetical protein